MPFSPIPALTFLALSFSLAATAVPKDPVNCISSLVHFKTAETLRSELSETRLSRDQIERLVTGSDRLPVKGEDGFYFLIARTAENDFIKINVDPWRSQILSASPASPEQRQRFLDASRVCGSERPLGINAAAQASLDKFGVSTNSLVRALNRSTLPMRPDPKRPELLVNLALLSANFGLAVRGQNSPDGRFLVFEIERASPNFHRVFFNQAAFDPASNAIPDEVWDLIDDAGQKIRIRAHASVLLKVKTQHRITDVELRRAFETNILRACPAGNDRRPLSEIRREPRFTMVTAAPFNVFLEILFLREADSSIRIISAYRTTPEAYAKFRQNAKRMRL